MIWWPPSVINVSPARLNEVLGDSLFLQINALVGGRHKEQPQLEAESP